MNNMKKALLTLLVSAILLGCEKSDNKSSDNSISNITLANNSVILEKKLDQENKQIIIVVKDDTDCTKLTPIVEIPSGATVNPEPNTEVDFTNSPVKFTVTAEDGKQMIYDIIVIEEKSNIALITEFKFSSLKIVGSIDNNNSRVTLYVNPGSDISNIKPTIKVTEFASVTPESGSVQDFSEPVKYKVISPCGKIDKEYTVTVIDTKSPEKKILNFNVVNTQCSIDETKKRVTGELPWNTELKLNNLTPQITISDKASISPSSESAQDFTNSVTYRVTAEDESTQEYSVTITIADAPDAETDALTITTYNKGEKVTITGKYFDEDNTIVKLQNSRGGSYQIAPESVSSTEIVITIPNSASFATGAYTIIIYVRGKSIQVGSINVN